MKRLIAACALVSALALPAVAQANTVSIPGFNCSVTAYTPTGGSGGLVNFPGGTSCGGSEYNYSKQIRIEAVDLVTTGWQLVHDTGWSGWSGANPLSEEWGFEPCVPLRWYADLVYANITHNGTESGAEASSESAGYQCP